MEAAGTTTGAKPHTLENKKSPNVPIINSFFQSFHKQSVESLGFGVKK